MPLSDPKTQMAAASRLQDLLALHDEAFVRRAYQTLLNRPADPAGLASHVALLREGADKAFLIVELARSKEGQDAAVDLPGLAEFVREHTPKAPTLSKRIVWRFANVFLAPLGPRLRALDNQQHALEDRLNRRLDRLEALASAQRAATFEAPGPQARAEAESRLLVDELLGASRRADLALGTSIHAARLGAALRTKLVGAA